MVALDTFQDNICLWRRIAVHFGARPDRSTAAARELAKSFWKIRGDDVPKTSMDELDSVEKHLNKQKPFSQWIGIRVYEPVHFGESEILQWRLTRFPPEKITNIVTIGVYDGHAFLIKDISKLAKTYYCAHCQASSTQAGNLQRHAQRCSKGETVIDCPGEKVHAPPTAFEKALYPKQNASPESIRWLERVAKRGNIHIHHELCGHGGERIILRPSVDRYHPPTRTVFQYHGCYWHGCPRCFPNNRNKFIRYRDARTIEGIYQETLKRTQALRDAGYKVLEVWACQVQKTEEPLPKTQTHSYPHAILYDFESYGDKNFRKNPTGMFTIESAHIPISVSIGDTLSREPTHIFEKHPAVLVRKFMNELQRRGAKIRKKVLQMWMPDDKETLPKAAHKKSKSGATRCLFSNSTPGGTI